jgi:hypothetical protein
MCPRSCIFLLGMSALLNAAQPAFGQSASGYLWCADGLRRSDSCYYGVGRLCQVTMSGLGVCVPSPRGSLRHQGVLIKLPH